MGSSLLLKILSETGHFFQSFKTHISPSMIFLLRLEAELEIPVIDLRSAGLEEELKKMH